MATKTKALPSADELRVLFAELGAQRDAILAVSGPLRAKLSDGWETLSRAKENDLRDQIKAAEEGLYDIDQERALISRALGGKTAMSEAE